VGRRRGEVIERGDPLRTKSLVGRVGSDGGVELPKVGVSDLDNLSRLSTLYLWFQRLRERT
jgi:hypothetical protein